MRPQYFDDFCSHAAVVHVSFLPLCHWDCQKRLSKEVCVIVAVPLGLSKKIVKGSLCNSRCAIGIVKKSLSKEDYVMVAVPLGLGMLRISKEAIWHTLCHWYSLQTCL